MSQEVTKILDILAERFGTTIEHLWGIMVRQAMVNSISNLALAVVTLVAILIVVQKWESWTDDIDEGGIGVPLIMFFGLFGVCGIIITIKVFPDTITGFFNPEYWVLQQILELLK